VAVEEGSQRLQVPLLELEHKMAVPSLLGHGGRRSSLP
jgi:hypothetical protein